MGIMNEEYGSENPSLLKAKTNVAIVSAEEGIGNPIKNDFSNPTS